MSYYKYPPQPVASLSGAGLATEAKQDDAITELGNILAALGGGLTVVDRLDADVLDASVSNIPASAAAPLEVVASTAAQVRKIYPIDDIGEYIGLYTGAAAAEVLACVLPLGGGEPIDLDIPAGTRLSLRHMKNTAISVGEISLNLIG